MKHPAIRPLCLLALAAVPVLAACGSDGAATSAGGAVALKEPAAVVAPAGGTIKVSLRQSQFAPATITAKVGQTITWTNSDAIAHTVTATANASFDSGTLDPGGTFSYVTKRAGRIDYVCEFHPGMTGTVTVR